MTVRNLLEVGNLCKSFGRGKNAIRAVDDVSFSIREGSTLGVLGESGSGKTSRIRFDGKELTWLTPAEMRQCRREMQMIFQNPLSSLNSKMTVAQNVADPLDIWSVGTPASRRARVRELLDMVGLASKSADAYPWEFSGGQQQRVAIARALAMRPSVMFFDEATSALDPKLTNDMHALIRELAQDGMAVGIVTHEMGFARMVSDRICLLHDGRIIESGTPEEVIDHPNKVEHHHPHEQEDEAHQQQMQSTKVTGHIHHHPQTYHQTDAHQQDGQEGDTSQTGNGTVVHLTFIGHIEQALAVAENEYPRDEQPSQNG